MTASAEVRARLLQLRQRLEQPRPAGAEYGRQEGTAVALAHAGLATVHEAVGARLCALPGQAVPSGRAGPSPAAQAPAGGSGRAGQAGCVAAPGQSAGLGLSSPGSDGGAAALPRRPLREAMPATAAMVAELRAALGAELVDKLLRRAMAGQPGVYFAELAADGQVLEFGRLADGRRAVPVLLPTGAPVLELRDRHGRPLPPLPMVPRDLQRLPRATPGRAGVRGA